MIGVNKVCLMFIIDDQMCVLIDLGVVAKCSKVLTAVLWPLMV